VVKNAYTSGLGGEKMKRLQKRMSSIEECTAKVADQREYGKPDQTQLSNIGSSGEKDSPEHGGVKCKGRDSRVERMANIRMD